MLLGARPTNKPMPKRKATAVEADLPEEKENAADAEPIIDRCTMTAISQGRVGLELTELILMNRGDRSLVVVKLKEGENALVEYADYKNKYGLNDAKRLGRMINAHDQESWIYQGSIVAKVLLLAPEQKICEKKAVPALAEMGVVVQRVPTGVASAAEVP